MWQASGQVNARKTTIVKKCVEQVQVEGGVMIKKKEWEYREIVGVVLVLSRRRME